MFYTTGDIFQTIKRVKLIKKKKFAIATLDLEYEAFVLYVATFNISLNINDKMHLPRKIQIAYLKVDETPIKIFSKYTNFVNFFS